MSNPIEIFYLRFTAWQAVGLGAPEHRSATTALTELPSFPPTANAHIAMLRLMGRLAHIQSAPSAAYYAVSLKKARADLRGPQAVYKVQTAGQNIVLSLL